MTSEHLVRHALDDVDDHISDLCSSLNALRLSLERLSAVDRTSADDVYAEVLEARLHSRLHLELSARMKNLLVDAERAAMEWRDASG